MQKRLAQRILLFGLLLLAACSQTGPATATSTTTPTPKPVNVYIGTIGDTSDDGAVIALNGATGQQLWKHNTGPDATSPPVPVLDHGVAYVGSDNSLFALSLQDGKLLWSYATPKFANVLGIANGLVYGTTNVDNPAIYALDTNSTDTSAPGKTALLALNASNGASLWSYRVPGIFSTPAVG